MIADFTPDLGFHKLDVTGPSEWRKHQVATAPALPTDVANGFPHGGYGGTRTRGNQPIKAFYSGIGNKRWGGAETFLKGHDSTHDENDMSLAPFGVNVDRKQSRRGFNPVLTLAPADRRGPIAPLPAGGGDIFAGGNNLNDVPPVVPSDPAFDFGVSAIQTPRPACPTTAEANQAALMASTGGGGDAMVAAAAKQTAGPARLGPAQPAHIVRGPGEAIRRMFQRPSRAGRQPIFFSSGNIRNKIVGYK